MLDKQTPIEQVIQGTCPEHDRPPETGLDRRVTPGNSTEPADFTDLLPLATTAKVSFKASGVGAPDASSPRRNCGRNPPREGVAVSAAPTPASRFRRRPRPGVPPWPGPR